MRLRAALGIHIGHDRGAAVVRDGDLVFQMAEERLDRVKHSNSPQLPRQSIAAALDVAGVRADQLGAIGVSYTNVVIADIVDQLAAEIRDVLECGPIPVHGIGHHDCHAWSTYFTSAFDRSLIVVADGAGDIVGNQIEAESAYIGSGKSLALVGRRLQDFGMTRTERRNAFNLTYMSASDRQKQISLGRKYEQFTYLVGFGHGHAGKTMALAAYGSPLFPPDIHRSVGLSFDLRFEDGLLEIDRAWKSSGEPWHRFVHQNAADIAAAGQAMVEAYVVQIIENLALDHGERNLCGAGGLFLSCRMNSRILSKTRVRHLHVVPAAGDDGQCVGAAFAAYATEFGAAKPTSQPLPYLGRQYGAVEIEDRLQYFGLNAERLDDGALLRRLAKDLDAGRVVAILRGRSEMGPRALCHRSLLADPRRAEMKDSLNRLKGRELFRPFAPVVTTEAQFEYFELPQDSPFMLLSAAVRERYRSVLPAIVHVDGTARVQAVARDGEPFIYDLLKHFEAATGYPILLNTSFNVGGDPIVESPHDAIVTFLSAEIDVLVLENYYVSRVLQALS